MVKVCENSSTRFYTSLYKIPHLILPKKIFKLYFALCYRNGNFEINGFWWNKDLGTLEVKWLLSTFLKEKYCLLTTEELRLRMEGDLVESILEKIGLLIKKRLGQGGF